MTWKGERMGRDEALRAIATAAQTGATELDLAGYDLTELPPEIGQLTQLATLILGKYTPGKYAGNELKILPSEIGLLKNLQVLAITGNWVHKYFPSKTPGNQLSALPPEIVQLTQLTQLDLSANQLSALPPEIVQLTQLTQLDLSANQLSALPPEIVQLTQLTQLDLSANQLSALPPEIVQLTQLTQLDLSANQLSALPPEIVQLTQLTQLDLSANQLSALPPEIVQLTQLTQLDLSANQLSALPPEIGQLTQLTQLDLSANQLSALPPEIGQLTQLTQLDLSANQLSALPPEIGQLTQLTQLDLSANQLSALPPEIGQLTQLTQLYLSKNQLSALPPEIVQLTQLTQLNLSANQLSALPPEIVQLTQLTQLNLSANQLSALPPEIVQLTQLTQLDLSENQLSALPSEIVQLTQLTQLNLSENRLSALPPEIVQLTQLTQLYLSENQLSALPPEIVQLTQLTQLYLSANRLSALPPEIVQLTQLTQLYLSENQLSALPPEIVQLTQLTQLDLSANQLSALPPEIVQLTQLTQLDLSENRLSALPPEIVQLTQLTQLNLSANQLSALPPEIVQLTQLTQLDLSANQLSALPPEIGQLTNLQYLWLAGSPLPIPPELLGNGWGVQAIFDFYFATQDPTATDPLYEAKFLIVGQGGAGKTSLAKKIQTPDYELDPEEESTHGIEVIQWHFPLDEGQDFRVNIWDFGGQEIYHQTHQFFLTERSLYALVADTRKENTDFPYWLNSIELFGGDSPVLLIKNEKGDRPCNVNERQLRGDFEHIQEFLPTNLKDGRGLDEIKAAIRYHITRLPFVGTPLPKKWVRVRYALENDARNYIDQRDYFALCERNGVSDRAEMLRISDFLHQLGICLHFQKDPVLKHLVILRPEWATNAVYAITTHKTVALAKGLFTRATAEDIWQKDYANLGDELLQLMEKFHLCYPIPGLDDHYMAPQLLPFDPPDYSWDDDANLMLRYEYTFMPKGVITQLIVRLHRWIEQQQHVWRSGVVLNNGRARAEVIETYRPYNGEIRIRVTGVHQKELLSVITHEIDEINATYDLDDGSGRHRLSPTAPKRPQVSKKIPCLCPECKTDPAPHFFQLQVLDRYLSKGRYTITCDKSCLDVPVRTLTAVLLKPDFSSELGGDKPEGFDEWAWRKRLEGRTAMHTEYHPDAFAPAAKRQGDIHINAENVLIAENTEGGDAAIHKTSPNRNAPSAET
jgi:Leucine-rich repeat (LRR) protein/GTPase SAR1 family protein